MCGNRNSYPLLVGMQNGTATVENSLVVSYKIKHILTIRPSNQAHWYLPKGTENLHLHKILYPSVYSSFIPNCQKLGATEIFLSR